MVMSLNQVALVRERSFLLTGKTFSILHVQSFTIQEYLVLVKMPVNGKCVRKSMFGLWETFCAGVLQTNSQTSKFCEWTNLCGSYREVLIYVIELYLTSFDVWSLRLWSWHVVSACSTNGVVMVGRWWCFPVDSPVPFWWTKLAKIKHFSAVGLLSGCVMCLSHDS